MLAATMTVILQKVQSQNFMGRQVQGTSITLSANHLEIEYLYMEHQIQRFYSK